MGVPGTGSAQPRIGPRRTLRVAAVGDVHLDRSRIGRYRPDLERVDEYADLLLLAGDLTRHGTVDEASCVAKEFRDLPVPVVAVLGNHDHHSDRPDLVAGTLQEAGITVLEGTATVVDCAGARVGVAGTKGFGGGFGGHRATAFGEAEMKAFVEHSAALADRFGAALRSVACDVRIGLTHYSPVAATLVGEPLEIYPFLGSYLLADAIDSAGDTALAVHGHAHAGSEHGTTPGGVAVRNVAHPLIRQSYIVHPVTW